MLLACGSLLAADASKEQIELGRYLVMEVGKCQECHTPLTDDGKLDESKPLKGQVLPVQPIATIKGWHKTSPDITPGSRLWSRWGEAGIKNFLVTGKNPNGGPAEAPMPTYHMKPADADAIVAYLKSLK